MPATKTKQKHTQHAPSTKTECDYLHGWIKTKQQQKIGLKLTPPPPQKKKKKKKKEKKVKPRDKAGNTEEKEEEEEEEGEEEENRYTTVNG